MEHNSPRRSAASHSHNSPDNDDDDADIHQPLLRRIPSQRASVAIPDIQQRVDSSTDSDDDDDDDDGEEEDGDDNEGTAGRASSANDHSREEDVFEQERRRRRRQLQRQQRQRRQQMLRRKRMNRGLLKKSRFLQHLLNSLDSLILLELGTLYYLECSIFRFIVRLVPHLLFLSPEPDRLPFHIPAARTYILSILAPNIICALFHIFSALPGGGNLLEEHRGYLHGGVLIDFIGQSPPSSCLPLLLLDAVIVVLQFLMLSVHVHRDAHTRLVEADGPQRRIRRRDADGVMVDPDNPHSGLVGGSSGSQAQGPQPTSVADADLAERGMATNLGRPGQGEEREIGMEEEDSEEERPGEAWAETLSATRGGELHDTLSSGLAVIGHYDLRRTLQTASMDYRSTAAQSIRTLGYTAVLAASRRG